MAIIEVKDLIGLNQPLTKLVEVVSLAIGSTFRPIQIRREADAKAYATVAMAKAEAEANVAAKQIALIDKQKTIDQLGVAHPEIAERAKQRLLTKEIEGLLNIEAIAQIAAAELPAVVPEQPMNQDWRRKFFSDAENICEQDMQMLWGKVLAGELARPGHFSLRTLNTLRQLSPAEAHTFARMCGLAMEEGWVALLGHDINTSLLPFGIDYQDFMVLRDAGLLMENDSLSKSFSAPTELQSSETEYQTLLVNNGLRILLHMQRSVKPSVRALIFTNAGKELQALIPNALNENYLKALAPHLIAAGFTKVKRARETVVDAGRTVMSFEDDL